MAVPNSTYRVDYNGDGTTTEFTVPFYFLANADVTVTHVSSAGAETVWTEGSQYSLTGAGDQDGGTLTATTAPASGAKLVIRRDVAATQEIEYPANDPFPSSSHEQGLDKLTMLAQQIQEQADRAIKRPVGDATSIDMTLPTKAQRAGKVAGWDSDGKPNAISQLDKSADTVTTENTSTARSLAERFGDEVHVKDDGASPDGTTDVHSEVQAAEARISGDSGGDLVFDWGASGYVIGDGSTRATGLTPPSNTRIRGVGGKPKLIHRAKNADGQNQLFMIEDVNGVTIENLEADGEEEVRNHITMRGVVSDVRFEHLYLHDGRNFALQYADGDVNPATAYFDGVYIADVRVDGETGLTGAGSGMIFFPRAQNAGLLPASSDLWMDEIDIDVSRGEASEADHGPQAIKLQNTNGFYPARIKTRGGDVASVVISTGVRNMFGGVFDMRFSTLGMIIECENQTATSRTQDIHPDHVHWDRDGVTGTVNANGLILRGFVPRTSVKEVTGNGDLVFQASTHKRWRLTGISGTFQVNETITSSSGGSGTIQAYSSEDDDVIQFTVSSGSFSASNTITGGTSGATATLDSETNLNATEGTLIHAVQLNNAQIRTDPRTETGLPNICGIYVGPMILNGGSSPLGRFNMSPDYPIQDSVFGPIIARRHSGSYALDTSGVRNAWGPVISVNGNPNSVATSMVVNMRGDHEVFPLISIQTHLGTHDIDNWFRCTSGNGGHRIMALAGTPSGGATHRGMDILNQEGNDPLLGDLVYHAGPFDLSGAAEEVLIPIDRNARVLSIVLTFPEATSADAGVALEVGVVGANTRFLNETTPTEQSDRLVYQNTAGTRSFSSRHIVAGETLRIAHAGGKAGDGMVGVVVNMVTVLS